ncbi:MAG: hypothetical protein AAGC67_04355 [Myxococcota bacterium]
MQRRSMRLPLASFVGVTALLVLAMASARADEAHDQDAHRAEDAHHARHAHTAPHGGSLVELGDEFAHLELVVDAASGRWTAYVLDGEAERGRPLQRASIRIAVEPAEGAPFDVDLLGVANVLTGETQDDTSQFSVQASRLRGLTRFHGRIRDLEVAGRRFQDVPFRVEPAAHAHDHAREDEE